jgi:hypothetical protein
MLPPRPVYFVENQGQAPTDVRFHAVGAGHVLLFQPDAIILRRSSIDDASATVASQVILRFVGAASDPLLEGREPLSGRVHFYRGREANTWQTDVPTFGGVRYRE